MHLSRYLTPKQIKMLRLLSQDQGHYVKGPFLRKELGVSERTIRNYKAQLDEVAEDCGYEIESLSGKGYCFRVTDQELWHETLKEQGWLNLSQIKSDSDQRQYWLIAQILLEENRVTKHSFQQKFLISDSTYHSETNQVRKTLGAYNLRLSITLEDGIQVKGDEADKRHFIMSYFFMKQLKKNIETFSDVIELIDEVSVEEILLIILDETRNADLKLTDLIIYNLALHISLALIRMQKDNAIDQSTLRISAHHLETVEYEVSTRIIQRVEESFQVTFPKEEVNFIFMHLYEDQHPNDEFDHLGARTLEVLQRIDADHQLNLSQDAVLVEGLTLHLKSLIPRLERQELIDNPMLESVQLKYGPELELTRHYFQDFPFLADYEVSMDEWVYIAIHLIASMEKQKALNKLKVLVVCASGIGSASLLRSRLESEFSYVMEIVDIIGYFEIRKYDAQAIDLVITTISLPDLLFSVPIIQVNVLLEKEDIETINQYIRQLNLGSKGVSKEYLLTTKQDLIRNFLLEDHYAYLDTEIRKESLLKKMIGWIQTDESLDIQEIYNQILLRETFSSLQMSPHVAIPHPMQALTQQTYVSLALLPQGLDWEEGGPPVRLVFLILPGREETQEIEWLADTLLPIMENNDYLEVLLHLKDFHKVKNFIMEVIIPLSN